MRRLLAACALLAAVLPSWGGECRTLAALLSTALPGAGQAYLGWRGSAQAFLVAEGMVWGSRYYLGHRADGVEDGYVAYGAAHAGSDPSVRDGAYYDDMTRYWNSERANQHYQDPYRYSGSKVWTWRSEDERRHFTTLVRDRRRWDSASKNVLAFAVLTRVASAVHCLKGGRSGPVAVAVSPGSLALSLVW
ncbi:MAG: hypothetical protein MUE60_03565 [Candidatus Eisenbacteria bacterium]|jgi:hypothetical protein|nr:hypothetical protein [Candidatus Eisenbacteria bacterium]